MRITKRAESVHLADDAAGTLLIYWNDGSESLHRTGDRFNAGDIRHEGELRPGIRRISVTHSTVHVHLETG